MTATAAAAIRAKEETTTYEDLKELHEQWQKLLELDHRRSTDEKTFSEESRKFFRDRRMAQLLVVGDIERLLEKNVPKAEAPDRKAPAEMLDPEMPKKPDFNAAVTSFLELAQGMIDDYMKKNFPGNGRNILSLTSERRYIRVVETSGGSRSCWAFIDKTNGDILKPDSWETPAKHSRGNIFSTNPLANMTPYGPASLR